MIGLAAMVYEPLIGYEMIIATVAWLSTISYPTRARGIIVNYSVLYFEQGLTDRSFEGIVLFVPAKNESRSLLL